MNDGNVDDTDNERIRMLIVETLSEYGFIAITIWNQ